MKQHFSLKSPGTAFIILIFILSCESTKYTDDEQREYESPEYVEIGEEFISMEYIPDPLEEYVHTMYEPGDFKLAYDTLSADIYVNSGDDWGVLRAASDLQADINTIVHSMPALKNTTAGLSGHSVIIGTVGKSPVIDELINSGKLDASDIPGKWESFVIQVVDNPLDGVEKGLVIAGSDRRGTIYGIYDLSGKIGVSPWHYWADIPPKTKDALLITPGTYTQGEPSVKYRGIFINDEAPSLSAWVDNTFGDYNHHFYEKVFELLLRLKANFLWPAMWDNAFSDDDPLNPELADKYGIVMSTSHHEPMMRAHKEWKKYGTGEWNYAANAETLYDFWEYGARRNGNYENIITIGMRGDGDEPMPGNTLGEKINLLKRIISDQRQIIADRINPDVTKVPQVWAIYKEVQSFYESGMRVREDITHLWCDDNFGNLRRLPTAQERKRVGGAGIYYHFDYVGGPRSYKWICTIPITKIWEQMSMAHDYGADRIWIVNVGDIKPMEYAISFFIDLAWDVDKWDKDSLFPYTIKWAEEQFGSTYARDIAEILMKYTKYNGIRKPEIITEKTFSIVHYREAEKVLAGWQNIVEKAEKIYSKLPGSYKDSFFQLVLYPVRASKHVMEMHYYAALNNLYYEQGRSMTNIYANLTQKIFQDEAKDTFYYNNGLSDGKWEHMMDQPHIGSKSWDGPKQNNMPEIHQNSPHKEAEMGIAIEGSTSTWPGLDKKKSEPCLLPEFSVYSGEKHYIEIFNKGLTPFEFTVTPKGSWIQVSVKQGIVVTQERIWVSIDWDKAPRGRKVKSYLKISGAGADDVKVHILVCNPRSPKKGDVAGFIESNGCISIEAEHYTRKTPAGGVSWERIYYYGRTGSSMVIFPATASSINPPGNAPCLEYDMYIINPGELRVTTYTAPSLNIAPDHGLRYALAFDSNPPVTVDTFRLDQDGHYSDKEWSQGVMDNICKEETTHFISSRGYHTLKIWMVDPGLVLQKIVVDTGGVKESYVGPPESYYSYYNRRKGIAEPGSSFDPVILPGKIEAENYNDGKSGDAYLDNTPGNAYSQYRDDDVDIDMHSGACMVRDMDQGEWLNYDIYAECTAEYTMDIYAYNGTSSDAGIHIECDKSNLSGTIVVPPGGSSEKLETISVPGLLINRGKHIITIYADTGSVNIDWIKFSTKSNKTWIEAETASHQPGFSPFSVQSDPGASGGKYIIMKSGTATEPPENGIAAYTFEAGGKVNIWMKVHAPTPNDDSFFLRLDKGGWQGWNNIGGAAVRLTWVLWRQTPELPDGTHILEIARREDGVKLDKILISPDPDFVPGGTYIEAESASHQPGFSPFSVLSDPDASGGKYIVMKSGSVTRPPDNGIAAYTFEAEGTAHIWMKVHMPTKKDNSFFLRIDDDYWHFWDNVEDVKEKWTWIFCRKIEHLSGEIHTLHIARQEDGTKLDTILVTDDLAFVPASYKNEPVPIPGKIEAEDYNKGLNGIAYYDSTKGNECSLYRKDDVDICDNADSYVVGYTVNREWLNYEVEIEKAGEYTLEVSGSNGTEISRTCHLECDGKDVIKPGGIKIPPTGNWDTYVPVVVPGVMLPQGRHTLTLFIDMSYINIDYMIFTLSDDG